MLFSRGGLRLVLGDEDSRTQKRDSIRHIRRLESLLCCVHLFSRKIYDSISVTPLNFPVSPDPETSSARLYENNTPRPAL